MNTGRNPEQQVQESVAKLLGKLGGHLLDLSRQVEQNISLGKAQTTVTASSLLVSVEILHDKIGYLSNVLDENLAIVIERELTSSRNN